MSPYFADVWSWWSILIIGLICYGNCMRETPFRDEKTYTHNRESFVLFPLTIIAFHVVFLSGGSRVGWALVFAAAVGWWVFNWVGPSDDVLWFWGWVLSGWAGDIRGWRVVITCRFSRSKLVDWFFLFLWSIGTAFFFPLSILNLRLWLWGHLRCELFVMSGIDMCLGVIRKDRLGRLFFRCNPYWIPSPMPETRLGVRNLLIFHIMSMGMGGCMGWARSQLRVLSRCLISYPHFGGSDVNLGRDSLRFMMLLDRGICFIYKTCPKSWLHQNWILWRVRGTCVILMMLGLDAYSGRTVMAAESWLHKALIWTCIGCMSAGKGNGFYVGDGYLMNTPLWFNCQFQGVQVWAGKMGCMLLSTINGLLDFGSSPESNDVWIKRFQLMLLDHMLQALCTRLLSLKICYLSCVEGWTSCWNSCYTPVHNLVGVPSVASFAVSVWEPTTLCCGQILGRRNYMLKIVNVVGRGKMVTNAEEYVKGCLNQLHVQNKLVWSSITYLRRNFVLMLIKNGWNHSMQKWLHGDVKTRARNWTRNLCSSPTVLRLSLAAVLWSHGCWIAYGLSECVTWMCCLELGLHVQAPGLLVCSWLLRVVLPSLVFCNLHFGVLTSLIAQKYLNLIRACCHILHLLSCFEYTAMIRVRSHEQGLLTSPGFAVMLRSYSQVPSVLYAPPTLLHGYLDLLYVVRVSFLAIRTYGLVLRDPVSVYRRPGLFFGQTIDFILGCRYWAAVRIWSSPVYIKTWQLGFFGLILYKAIVGWKHMYGSILLSSWDVKLIRPRILVEPTSYSSSLFLNSNETVFLGRPRFLFIPSPGCTVSYFWSPKCVLGDVTGGMPP
ncbi:hypothetical protein HanPI659440_Chr01g0000001 [Helianthus annuus]|nr:hypothetical protein HanPI659440_Chr01g0000001 [Helianthus annuus]